MGNIIPNIKVLHDFHLVVDIDDRSVVDRCVVVQTVIISNQDNGYSKDELRSMEKRKQISIHRHLEVRKDKDMAQVDLENVVV